MKLTLGQIEELSQILTGLPVKSAGCMKVAKNIVKLQDHVKVLQDTKDRLIKLHGENGEAISPNSKNWLAFWGDYNKVLREEVEVEGLTILEEKEINTEKDIAPSHLAVLIYHKLLTPE